MSEGETTDKYTSKHFLSCCIADVCVLFFFFFERRRERHAKTIDIAQEEVLTCLGIHLYERLHRIWQKLRAEEQTWQILFHLGIDALRKSFEVSGIQLDGYKLDGRRWRLCH